MHPFALFIRVVGVAKTVRGSTLFKNSSVIFFTFLTFLANVRFYVQLSRGRVGITPVIVDP